MTEGSPGPSLDMHSRRWRGHCPGARGDKFRGTSGLARALERGARSLATCASCRFLATSTRMRAVCRSGRPRHYDAPPGAPRRSGELVCGTSSRPHQTLTGFENHGGARRPLLPRWDASSPALETAPEEARVRYDGAVQGVRHRHHAAPLLPVTPSRRTCCSRRATGATLTARCAEGVAKLREGGA